MSKLDGYKNYIFGGALILNGAVGTAWPDWAVATGLEPATSITMGVGWVLGRNAVKKLEGIKSATTTRSGGKK